VAQYFYGDNLDGYFEGHTFRYAQGAGYFVRRRAIYRDFLSWCGERLNDREVAESAAIYPHAVRHNHGPSWGDEFMLLRKRRALALRVFSRTPRSLAVAPLLDLRRDEVSLYSVDGAVILHSTRGGPCLAFSSSRPFRHDGTAPHDRFFAPVFRTLQDEQEFALYAAFGRDPAAAAAQARRLREDDGVRQHIEGIFIILTRGNFWTSDAEYNRALAWAKLSSYFMVTDEFGKGIWAGLPWFKDNWGRDTFISLPGALLAGGCFEEAKEIIRNFARLQNKDPQSPDYGRIPNRVAGPRDIIYNTADGTPWMIREIYDYLCHTGETGFAAEMYPVVKEAIAGALQHWADPQGFLTHDDADTWMDARIAGRLPWSARGNRANDVQALWFAALMIGARLAELNRDSAAAKKWRLAAEKLKKNFTKLFWDKKKKRMADRIRADGTADLKVRPNQLMLLTVPYDERLLDAEIEAAVLKNAVGELLYPYGIASLSQADPYFHPHHDGVELHHKDAAYHNGTVWGWNAGFTVTALCRHGQTELAWKLARNLADQILNLGCRGAMSELLDALPDAKGKLKPSGTWAQTWSTAEFVRNGHRDFGGFEPRLLDNEIRLEPHIPAEWTSFSATHPFGRGAMLQVAFTRQHGKEVFVIRSDGHAAPIRLRLTVAAFGRLFRIERELKATDTFTVVMDAKAAITGTNGQWDKPFKGEKLAAVKPLKFAQPTLKFKPRAVREKDFLKKIIEAGHYR